MIAAIGLSHGIEHGRIVQICGNEVERLYFKSGDHQPPFGKIENGEPASTIGFYGLARVGDSLWALGSDGLYRFSAGKFAEYRPLPPFVDRGGYRVSFAVPGLVLVIPKLSSAPAACCDKALVTAR